METRWKDEVFLFPWFPRPSTLIIMDKVVTCGEKPLVWFESHGSHPIEICFSNPTAKLQPADDRHIVKALVGLSPQDTWPCAGSGPLCHTKNGFHMIVIGGMSGMEPYATLPRRKQSFWILKIILYGKAWHDAEEHETIYTFRRSIDSATPRGTKRYMAKQNKDIQLWIIFSRRARRADYWNSVLF